MAVRRHTGTAPPMRRFWKTRACRGRRGSRAPASILPRTCCAIRDDRPALVSIMEGGEVAAQLTYADLFAQVARMARFLSETGVTAGDRVAGYLLNCVETVVSMLAATSLGAIWSSCSPDFGFQSVVERFGQIEPKVLVAADGYRYHGRSYDSLPRVAEVARGIESVARVVIVPLCQRVPGPFPGAPILVVGGGVEQRRRRPSTSRSFHSTTRSTSCTRQRHHRRAQVHRARGRRHADPARQGTACCKPTSAVTTPCSTSPPAAG